jgi:hypothetical protein
MGHIGKVNRFSMDDLYHCECNSAWQSTELNGTDPVIPLKPYGKRIALSNRHRVLFVLIPHLFFSIDQVGDIGSDINHTFDVTLSQLNSSNRRKLRTIESERCVGLNFQTNAFKNNIETDIT